MQYMDERHLGSRFRKLLESSRSPALNAAKIWADTLGLTPSMRSEKKASDSCRGSTLTSCVAMPCKQSQWLLQPNVVAFLFVMRPKHPVTHEADREVPFCPA